jgi:hypothetical protein
MKKLLPLLLLIFLPITIISCKGKTGDRGAGTTRTTCTGTIPATVDGNGNAMFDVSIPAVTADSIVTVYVSSSTGIWGTVSINNYDGSSLDLTLKSIHFKLASDFIGWDYKIFVDNPD